MLLSRLSELFMGETNPTIFFSFDRPIQLQMHVSGRGCNLNKILHQFKNFGKLVKKGDWLCFLRLNEVTNSSIFTTSWLTAICLCHFVIYKVHRPQSTFTEFVGTLYKASGGTNLFWFDLIFLFFVFLWGIEGAKCVSEGAKIQIFAENDWFLSFFRGGGAEPPTGRNCPLTSPLGAATVQSTCLSLNLVCRITQLYLNKTFRRTVRKSVQSTTTAAIIKILCFSSITSLILGTPCTPTSRTCPPPFLSFVSF